MDTFILMLRNVLVFLLLAVPGYILVKTKLLKESDTPPLSKILVNVGMPALIFANTISMDIRGGQAINLTLTALITFIFILVFNFATIPVTNRFGDKNAIPNENGIKERPKCVTAQYSAVFANTGFLGLPLAKAVFGASPVIDYMVVINIVGCIMLNTLGVYTFTGDKNKISLKNILLNPTVLAFIVGLAVNISKICTYVPEISLFANHVSGLVTPISMMIVGIKLASVDLVKIFTSTKMYIVSVLKLIIQPVVIVAVLLLARLFIDVPTAIILGFFTALSMPTAGTATTFADNFGGDVDGAVIYTLGTTILSAISISFLYFAVMLLV